MNPTFRKVALTVASLGLLLSLFLALRPNDDGDDAVGADDDGRDDHCPRPRRDRAARDDGDRAAGDDERRSLRTWSRSGSPCRATPPEGPALSVKQGRKVVIVVRSELSDHVHLHGYDLIADVGPGQPATIRFTANSPGRFEIELEDRGLEIAELEVRP